MNSQEPKTKNLKVFRIINPSEIDKVLDQSMMTKEAKIIKAIKVVSQVKEATQAQTILTL